MPPVHLVVLSAFVLPLLSGRRGEAVLEEDRAWRNDTLSQLLCGDSLGSLRVLRRLRRLRGRGRRD